VTRCATPTTPTREDAPSPIGRWCTRLPSQVRTAANRTPAITTQSLDSPLRINELHVFSSKLHVLLLSPEKGRSIVVAPASVAPEEDRACLDGLPDRRFSPQYRRTRRDRGSRVTRCGPGIPESAVDAADSSGACWCLSSQYRAKPACRINPVRRSMSTNENRQVQAGHRQRIVTSVGCPTRCPGCSDGAQHVLRINELHVFS